MEYLFRFFRAREPLVAAPEALAAAVVPRRVRAVQAAEALECPYQTAQAALDEVKTGMPDGNYKTIADALMLAHRAKRELEAETEGIEREARRFASMVDAARATRRLGARYAEGMFVATVN